VLKRGKRTSGARGFTLVELLLAMTIIAASLGAIYGVFHAGLAAWNSGTDESMLAYESTFLLDSISRDLRAVELVKSPEKGDETPALPIFVGAADSMEFFTASVRTGGMQWPGHRLKYYFDKEKSAEWGTLKVKDTPSAGSVTLVSDGSDEIVIDRVYSFGLRFLKDGAWADTWKEESLPAAVEIGCEMGSDSGKLRRSFKVIVDIPAWKAGQSSG
jgi:type II secretion system protein J